MAVAYAAQLCGVTLRTMKQRVRSRVNAAGETEVGGREMKENEDGGGFFYFDHKMRLDPRLTLPQWLNRVQQHREPE